MADHKKTETTPNAKPVTTGANTDPTKPETAPAASTVQPEDIAPATGALAAPAPRFETTGPIGAPAAPAKGGVHACIAKYDNALKREGSQLARLGFNLDDNAPPQTFYVATEKVEKTADGPRPKVVALPAHYCPFCGDRI